MFMAKKGDKSRLIDLLIVTFWRQNSWHKHGVFVHTLNVVFSTIKYKDYKMIPAAIMHDFGKPGVSTRDVDKDILSYSFKGHEEKSYEIIKDWSFVSEYTKQLVRWHYLIRGKSKDKEKYESTNKESFKKEYERQQREWDNLDESVKNDLRRFLQHDDNGKNIKNLFDKDCNLSKS